MKRKADSAITLPTVARADDTASANGGERGHTTLETAKQRFAQPPVPIPVAPFALAAGLGRGSTRAIKKGDLDLVRVTVWSWYSTCASGASPVCRGVPRFGQKIVACLSCGKRCSTRGNKLSSYCTNGVLHLL